MNVVNAIRRKIEYYLVSPNIVSVKKDTKKIRYLKNAKSVTCTKVLATLNALLIL